MVSFHPFFPYSRVGVQPSHFQLYVKSRMEEGVDGQIKKQLGYFKQGFAAVINSRSVFAADVQSKTNIKWGFTIDFSLYLYMLICVSFAESSTSSNLVN